MFGRKPKDQPLVPGRDRARVNASGANPAFSYYASRSTEPVRRPEPRTTAAEQSRSAFKWTGRLPLALLLVVGLICAGKLLLLGSDPKVIVLGTNAVSAGYLKPTSTYEHAAQKLLAASITNHSKITVNLDGVASALRKQFPELQAVSITVPLVGNRPIVYAQVAQPSVIVQSTHGSYALNASGLALSAVHDLPPGVPVLVDQSGSQLHLGEQFLPGTTVTAIQTIAYQFAAAKVSITTFVLPTDKPYELDVRIEGKPYTVRFSVIGDVLLQSGAAIATVQQLGAANPGTYIDVRVPNRVYYQ